MGLYEVLKAAKIGAASDVLTTLRGQQAPFAKGGGKGIKELEDDPPLSFTGNGEPLIDWRIDGASGSVGDKTENIYNSTGNPIEQGSVNGTDGTNLSSSSRIRCKNKIDIASGSYTLSAVASKDLQVFLFLYDSSGAYTERIPSDWIDLPYTFTVENNGKFRFVIRYKDNSNIAVSEVSNVMLNAGSSALPYEPYGKYKIPITCGGVTNTLLLDAPLGASDSISMTGTGVSIPTVDGSNTLSVGTTVQPSEVYIKWKG